MIKLSWTVVPLRERVENQVELCDFILDAQGIEKEYIVSEGAKR